MRPAYWRRMDVAARRLTPFGLTLILVVLNVVPLHVPALAMVFPVLPLIAIYHWAIYRPELMPYYAVFFIGLLQDILTNMPIGVNALVFLGVHGAVISQSRFFTGKSFAIVWLGFALVAAAATLANWVLISVYNIALISPGAVFFQYLLTLGCFPFFAWVFLRWQQTFLEHD